MAKTKLKIAASSLLLFFTFGLACASFPAFGSSALNSSQDNLWANCMKTSGESAKTECTQPKWMCPFGSTPGLAPVPRYLSSLSNAFIEDCQLLIANDYVSRVPDKVFLSGRASVSGNQIVFLQKISTHLLNSVLTL